MIHDDLIACLAEFVGPDSRSRVARAELAAVIDYVMRERQARAALEAGLITRAEAATLLLAHTYTSVLLPAGVAADERIWTDGELRERLERAILALPVSA